MSDDERPSVGLSRGMSGYLGDGESQSLDSSLANDVSPSIQRPNKRRRLDKSPSKLSEEEMKELKESLSSLTSEEKTHIICDILDSEYGNFFVNIIKSYTTNSTENK
eukprot:TRINITY_DN11341_c0_g1_i1.p1 TRINITY_DN11341_c0_g1~~TRINITY_DN11341_c0_g1_i1.p1  ORF type:complete len:107 (-),score=22.74 TRINITY_DN11341_c0_g1_i1:8-328(-)